MDRLNPKCSTTVQLGFVDPAWKNKTMMNFLVRTLGNMAGVWIASWLLVGIAFRQGESWGYTLLYLFVISVILTAANMIIRPVIRVLAFPLYILTLGLFSLVTNGLVFLAAGWVSDLVRMPLIIDGFWTAVWGGTITAIVASIVSGILGGMLPNNATNRR